MEGLQEKHERAVGDMFFENFNRRNGTSFRFAGRPEKRPDGIYREGDREILVEVSTSYYDRKDARVQWENAREKHGAPESWRGENADKLLVNFLRAEVAKKCGIDYPDSCILLLSVSPPITSAVEMAATLKDIVIPERVPFRAIYLTGEFGYSSESVGGYRCWMLYPDRLPCHG